MANAEEVIIGRICVFGGGWMIFFWGEGVLGRFPGGFPLCRFLMPFPSCRWIKSKRQWKGSATMRQRNPAVYDSAGIQPPSFWRFRRNVTTVILKIPKECYHRHSEDSEGIWRIGDNRPPFLHNGIPQECEAERFFNPLCGFQNDGHARGGKMQRQGASLQADWSVISNLSKSNLDMYNHDISKTSKHIPSEVMRRCQGYGKITSLLSDESDGNEWGNEYSLHPPDQNPKPGNTLQYPILELIYRTLTYGYL